MTPRQNMRHRAVLHGWDVTRLCREEPMPAWPFAAIILVAAFVIAVMVSVLRSVL